MMGTHYELRLNFPVRWFPPTGCVLHSGNVRCRDYPSRIIPTWICPKMPCVPSMVLLWRRHRRKSTVNAAASPSTASIRAKATHRVLAIMLGTVLNALLTNAAAMLSNWVDISILPGITFRLLLYVSYFNPTIDPFVHLFLMPKLRTAGREMIGGVKVDPTMRQTVSSGSAPGGSGQSAKHTTAADWCRRLPLSKQTSEGTAQL